MSNVTFLQETPNWTTVQPFLQTNKVLELTHEFAVDLRSCLYWGKPTLTCWSPVTDVLHSKIHCSEMQSSFCDIHVIQLFQCSMRFQLCINLTSGMLQTRHLTNYFCKWPTWGTILFLYVYFNSLHVSSKLVLIIRRTSCINTTSVSVWPSSMQVGKFLPDLHTS
jgi:hypothetical protein